MLHNVLSYLSGALVAPIGSVACVLAVYAILALLGKKEDQGQRGLLAGALGIVPGAIIGFLLGLSLARIDPMSSNAWLAHLSVAALDALAIGCIGWLIGNHGAEVLDVSDCPRQRSSWSLFYVALPLAFTNGVGLYVALHVVSR